MADSDLKRQPHEISMPHDYGVAWWFEESAGIVISHTTNGVTETIPIPWKALRGALARKDRPAKRHAKRKR